MLVKNQTKNEYSNNVSSKFLKKIRILEKINSNLTEKITKLRTYGNQLQDVKIKYLTLKEKLLETEEKLLMNGIDTSKYPVFSMVDEEQDTETNPENEEDLQIRTLMNGYIDAENQ